MPGGRGRVGPARYVSACGAGALWGLLASRRTYGLPAGGMLCALIEPWVNRKVVADTRYRVLSTSDVVACGCAPILPSAAPSLQSWAPRT